MGLDLSGVDRTPLNNIAVNLGIIILITFVVTTLIIIGLRAIRLPNVVVDKLIGIIAIIVLFGTIYIMDDWGLFVGFKIEGNR